jgi:hypothetical protein
VESIREEMRRLREQKERHFQINKLDRIIKNEFRFGVLGQSRDVKSELGRYESQKSPREGL